MAGLNDGIYPMRAVTRMTGLSADTIRVWERRHCAVHPQRTAGNARRYTADQVRRLILLQEATSRGHAIGDLATLNDEALRSLASGNSPAVEQPAPRHPVVDEYLEAAAAFQSRRAADVLHRTAVLLPPGDMVFRVLVPVLHEVGGRWETGEFTVAHEHMVSNHVKALLASMVRLIRVDGSAPRIVIATPPGHHHEFGSLIGAFIAASRNIEPVYLGANLPWEDLTECCRSVRPRAVLLSVVLDSGNDQKDIVGEELRKLSEVTPVWLGLPKSHPLSSEDIPIRKFHDFERFDTALNAEL
ncbi:MAG: MerR family transcriptional regulator [Myxococcota bacterium]